MRKILISLLAFPASLCLGGLTTTASAGTQDFTLVNKTGVDLHNLYISENDKKSWEEDVLGDDVLENGTSVKISFSGKDECLWDMMVKSEDESSAAWDNVNLCELEKVVLHCDGKKCWATGE